MPSKLQKIMGSDRSEIQKLDLTMDLPPRELNSEPQTRFQEFGNPVPLGLCSFALTILLLSLINLQARNVLVPNVIIGVGSS